MQLEHSVDVLNSGTYALEQVSYWDPELVKNNKGTFVAGHIFLSVSQTALNVLLGNVGGAVSAVLDTTSYATQQLYPDLLKSDNLYVECAMNTLANTAQNLPYFYAASPLLVAAQTVPSYVGCILPEYKDVLGESTVQDIQGQLSWFSAMLPLVSHGETNLISVVQGAKVSDMMSRSLGQNDVENLGSVLKYVVPVLRKSGSALIKNIVSTKVQSIFGYGDHIVDMIHGYQESDMSKVYNGMFGCAAYYAYTSVVASFSAPIYVSYAVLDALVDTELSLDGDGLSLSYDVGAFGYNFKGEIDVFKWSSGSNDFYDPDNQNMSLINDTWIKETLSSTDNQVDLTNVHDAGKKKISSMTPKETNTWSSGSNDFYDSDNQNMSLINDTWIKETLSSADHQVDLTNVHDAGKKKISSMTPKEINTLLAWIHVKIYDQDKDGQIYSMWDSKQIGYRMNVMHYFKCQLKIDKSELKIIEEHKSEDAGDYDNEAYNADVLIGLFLAKNDVDSLLGEFYDDKVRCAD